MSMLDLFSFHGGLRRRDYLFGGVIALGSVHLLVVWALFQSPSTGRLS
jgi:hypothetical protein